MQELLENYVGELDEELEEAIEIIESYIAVEGFEWVSGLLEEIEDMAYLEGISKKVKEQLEQSEWESEPFTAEDALATKRSYIVMMGMAKDKEDMADVKKMFLGDSEEEEEDAK